MNRPTDIELINAAEEFALVARYNVDVNTDRSGDYRIGSIVGLTRIDELRQGIYKTYDGDCLIPLVRCVFLSIDMPNTGRLPAPALRSRLADGLKLHYESTLAAQNLRLDRQEIAGQVGELMDNDAYQQPGSKWSLSVLGDTAFSAAQRGLYLAGGVVPVELELAASPTPNRGYKTERADNLYVFAGTAHRRLYEMSPDHGEAVRTNGIG